jgi:hypothetical protein
MRIRWASHIADNRRQVKLQHTLVLCMRETIGPQASDLGIGLNQFHLLVAATRQLQVLNGLLIDAEHRRSRTILGRHVGDSGAIT